ncbi:putative phospho-2-dehydro-3-deoxyheptonate aldolase [Geoglobus ahangari]|uniref:2-amino-3,7-dideoxy-D-threo-hept-6-ulosonate synthase n=1 Tax=Geoglobus ahangari TaxID=113653 RepID=A0A0F7ICG9_9EURY|nr:2-amino-3,7-dideoxy-D-threo-hept-6-ulosonate synthase [Geoglobus ahangari]AKG90970.1 putative phospho-2-dehydro-3-deoxyheptonate aldolase [Geoglobus ahangari]NOY11573.1 class I fructose-bisphosphate aldolase family protein [Archaeoglobi archaeon]
MHGKKRRMRRILKGERTFIVPMDHGMTKPEVGLENVDRMLALLDGIVDAFVLHKGMVKHSDYVDEMESALIVHLSASTYLSPDPLAKRVVTSVEKAIQLGADAVSVHVNVGSDSEGEQIREASMISEACDDYGIPLLVMSYPRGRGINEFGVEEVKLAVRVANEIGGDIVKTNYTGSVETFREVVEHSRIPVVIAGGIKKESSAEFLEVVKEALDAGAKGVAAGRNIFQAENPRELAIKIARVIHGVVYERDLVNR